ncbi:metallophosphoesterase family protein [Clostridium septicum]|uniref:Metallophosphatase family protein n=1 Tax=Clostridium septicum TaxID=1504 RepID=A0A9N7JNK2_CLOSE|nr:metallophosphoesterase family protein [Clostridium septicum]AYE35763.1 metallophosphoesterase [Clostridium septicum]MDU1314986.1 metallophosphoesterase family protein [Clostridium septicum]QAS61102.1 metallophosphoesterase [Clostridium septicum]UEC19561.1 metallophosphatase family protein [Clostridium septicum]USS02381.1 metallophosphatase family protein [Clostridium septicum]
MREKIAIISDVHGNLNALNTVFNDINKRGITRIICLGDLVGKGPNTEEVVDKVKNNCEIVIKGNWDYLVSEVNNKYFVKWHKEKLRNDQLEYLKNLPIYSEFYISGNLVRIFHSSIKDLFFRVAVESTKEDKLKLFIPPQLNGKEADIVIYGHLHYAFIEYFAGKTLINVGSVGNPLEISEAAYAIIEGEYNSKKKDVISTSIIRIPYDVNKSIEDAEKSDMPDKEEYIYELKYAIYRGLKK